MADTKLRLARAALALRARDPSAWDDFVAALTDHATDVRDGFLKAAPGELLLIQGRAQACAYLLAELQNARSTVEQAESRLKGRS
ncbi:hypothetical protein [Methylobacterium sp. 285MFTsu5.1]|uniref:hypothetical protein n=1 Tax=Methylobacterium sp. 285MFTsu5.1 TaxID=1172187 RepID=UPI00036782F0|nr:hypothetical protein [Methylobacterium sp. 285MFTsu5.1]